MESSGSQKSFIKKVWTAASILVFLVLVVLLLKATVSVILMILAGTLIALFFHGFAGLIERKSRLSRTWSMAFSVALTLLSLFLIFWLMGSKIQSQTQELSAKFPGMVEQAKGHLNQSAIGQKILDQTSGQNSKKLTSSIKNLFSSTFGVLGDLYVILFLGLFFTADPKVYKDGIVALVPKPYKKEGVQILNELGHNLTSWLKGKLFSMAVVAILTGVGLWVLGIPLVLTLALVAGILNFIPNFGPIIAMVPAVLIGLSLGMDKAVTVAGLYIFIQMLESNLITPMIQKKLVSIPPAMIIVGQLVVGSLTGYLGIILATPVVLIIMVLTTELYVKKQDNIK